ncbi:hypothetical protein [Alkalicoccobacillus plakortidis]|nr:hypothetical protein [Alkalicoccobacillus plakortidis]
MDSKKIQLNKEQTIIFKECFIEDAKRIISKRKEQEALSKKGSA